jgi:predicted ATPase/transcriptional regulator with XRE-family HTH domain
MIEEYSFGAWVRRRRKGLDLTQQELAHRINCSLSTIVKIESDQRRPSRQIAELLAKHLSIPENQRELFFKVARGLKPVDQLWPFSIPLESLLKTTSGRTTCNLPSPTNPLVGRKHELAEIVGLITNSECRLLTIVGLGGVGKTRLALQVAHDLSDANSSPFSDGLCFVPLASVISTQNIPKAIAGAIGFDISGPLSPENQLLNYLNNRTMLLVLDNVEHLLDGVEFFSKILERAPRVKLLVTSRERLNLSCEWVFDLHGLPVPPSDMDKELENYSAARLFLDRVQQAKTRFSLRREDRPVVGQICRMLDGIPLGIELAAAWVRTLPLCEIAAEITNDLDFLTSSARDIPERHRSLRVVFDHSWNRLSSAERRTLHHLSTFKGGFTRQAAEEVTEFHISVLNSLIDKSLLRRSESARYELHELVRVYAATRLADKPEEEAAAQQYHGMFFLSMVRDAMPDLQSIRQKEALGRLSVEMANIRLAWAWAVAQDRIDLLREAAWSLWYFFDLRSYYREAEAAFANAAHAVRRCLKSAG